MKTFTDFVNDVPSLSLVQIIACLDLYSLEPRPTLKKLRDILSSERNARLEHYCRVLPGFEASPDFVSSADTSPLD